MILIALIHHLLNAPGVGEHVGNRIYNQTAPALQPPQNQIAQLPYIIVSRITTPRERHLRGSSGLPHPRFQISMYGNDALQMERLAQAVRLCLDTKRNYDMGPSDYQVNVRSAICEDERDFYEAPEHDQQTGLYRKDFDFIFWHLETVPS